ncbi:MAG TPA: hypothetical protein VMS77_02750 [Conexivisphaerales archaeon]|nr:hypothetical protein [Conexivisphaerales archaeon]
MAGTKLLVGTSKGAFIFTGDASRRNWKARGPFFAKDLGALGEVYHLAIDRRNKGRVFAAVNPGFTGPNVYYTDDLGANWKASEPPRFPKRSKLTAKNIWHITPGREGEPGTLYLGLDPFGLFLSRDVGEKWEVVEGITYHKDRREWNPGFGGPCLHTIALDPRSEKEMWVGMSAAGVYHTSDMESWEPRNRGIRVDYAPEKFPAFGQCVHKFALSADGRTLYLQNHGGVYRSEDRGRSWIDVGKELPSDFGFALAAHPSDPKTFYVVPLETPSRYVPEARPAVYRTSDRGETWQAMRSGFPAKAYLTVLREGMCTDGNDPAGVYVGAKNGSLYFSRDDGEHFELLAENLPSIVSVTAG